MFPGVLHCVGEERKTFWVNQSPRSPGASIRGQNGRAGSGTSPGGGQIQRGAATAPGVPGDAPGRAQPPVGARCEVAVRRARFLRGSDVPPPGRFLASPRPGPFSFPRLIFHVPRVSFSRCFFPTKRVLLSGRKPPVPRTASSAPRSPAPHAP